MIYYWPEVTIINLYLIWIETILLDYYWSEIYENGPFMGLPWMNLKKVIIRKYFVWLIVIVDCNENIFLCLAMVESKNNILLYLNLLSYYSLYITFILRLKRQTNLKMTHCTKFSKQNSFLSMYSSSRNLLNIFYHNSWLPTGHKNLCSDIALWLQCSSMISLNVLRNIHMILHIFVCFW